MSTTFIYVLKEPDTEEIRYVGKSNDPKERLRCHLKDGNNKKRNHRIHWISFLKSRGLAPRLEIIDEVPLEHWPQWEVAYIEYFREQGCALVNGTGGGEGAGSGASHPNFGKPGWMQGKKHSAEVKEKCRAARLKQVITSEMYAKGGNKRTGTKKPVATSRYHGVFWNVEKNKWTARISIRNIRKWLGNFSSEISAAKARDTAAKIYHGSHAVLNFP